MNEFIVWDKIAKHFADDICLDAELLQDGISYSLEVKEELFELFYPVGLKDINEKSIYSDSSIVEFDYMNDIYKGFFYFNENELMYFIKILSSSFKYADLDGSFPYTNIKICDFKIIDTIQENKLGLIKG